MILSNFECSVLIWFIFRRISCICCIRFLSSWLELVLHCQNHANIFKRNKSCRKKFSLGLIILQMKGLGALHAEASHPLSGEMNTQLLFTSCTGGFVHPLNESGAPSTHEYDPFTNLKENVIG